MAKVTLILSCLAKLVPDMLGHYYAVVFMSDSTLLPVFTRAQLALRNGQDRDEIWCAFAGIIYDVSGSRLWRNGKHYEHWAGQDLTDELADAPHSESVFSRFRPVGKLG